VGAHFIRVYSLETKRTIKEIKMDEDYDEMFDQEDLEELYEGAEEGIEPEDVFNMVLINKIKKTRIQIELEDEDGDIVPLKDVIQQLLGYIKDQLKDEDGNQFADQIMPLMAHSVVSGLGRMIGLRATAFHLANDTTRLSLIHMMCLGLLLLKFVQQKNLHIITHEEDVTDEEIEEVERRTEANKAAVLASLAGEDPKATLRELRRQGHITEEDLSNLLGESDDDEEEDV